METKTYRILLNEEPEGGFTVTVPALPGCTTYGENLNHALEMAKEAIEGYIEVLKEKENQFLMIAKLWNIHYLLLHKWDIHQKN
jgi:antitoxin HicB